MVYKEPTKKEIDGEIYYFHTAHATKKEAEELQSFLAKKHPRKYNRGNTKITHNQNGDYKLWAKKWW